MELPLRHLFALLILALAVLPLTAHAQQYTPTKAQHAKLAKARAAIIDKQEKIQELQNEMQFAIEQAQQTCKQIAAQNGWPADVTCNLQTLSFAAPAPKAEEKKK